MKNNFKLFEEILVKNSEENYLFEVDPERNYEEKFRKLDSTRNKKNNLRGLF